MIASVDGEALSDERGWRWESQADAANEGAKMVPMHVGNVDHWLC
jgi:hypothetical protein